MPVFGPPKPPPKKSNVPPPTRKWVPPLKKKVTVAGLKATTNALRASGDKIAKMERKIDKLATEMSAPHPLLELLERKKTPISGKSGKTIIVAGGDHSADMYSDDPPECITLKSRNSYADDIHKAREVQKLIENRRRFFDGELNTTFDKVGSQTMKGNSSSDDEDTPSVADSGRATYGSSIGSARDNRLEEAIPSPGIPSMINYSTCKSSGYSEDDELSVAESCEDLTGKLTRFQQKAQCYNNRNMETDKQYSNMYKQMLRDPDTSHENFIMAKRYLLPDRLLPKANYKPGSRGQKKLTKVNPNSGGRKPKTPTSGGWPTQRRKWSANSPDQGMQLIRPMFKRGWTAFKRAKAMGLLRWQDYESDKEESSSDEFPPTPNLSLLQSTGPSLTDTRFSMTHVIETTRLAEREADIQMGLIGPIKKKVKKRYGPIAAISSRVSGRVASAMSSQPVTPTSNSARSSITASTPQNRKITKKIVVKDEKIVKKIVAKEKKTFKKSIVKDEKVKTKKASPIEPKKSVVEKSEDPTPIPVEEIKTANDYVTLKLDSNSNIGMPSIMLPSLNRFQHSQISSLRSLTATKNLNSWVPKNYLEDKRASSKLLKAQTRPPYQAFRGQSRHNLRKDRGSVPVKEEEDPTKETTEERKKISEPVIKYTKLQRKQETVQPGDPDVTNDPRFWSLLEVLVPVYKTRFPTWKNMPASAIPPPATPQESNTSIELPAPAKTAVQKKRKSYPALPKNHIPLSPPQ